MSTQTIYFNNPADITELQNDATQYSILPVQSRRPDFSQLSQTVISGLPINASFSLYDIGRQFTQITNALYAKLDNPVVAAQIDYLCETGGSYGYAYAADWCCNVMHAALTGPSRIVAGATGYSARLIAINVDGNCLFNSRGGTAAIPVAPVGLETFFPRATGTDSTIVQAYNASSPVYVYLTGAYQSIQGVGNSYAIASGAQAVPLLDVANQISTLPFVTSFLTVSSTGVPADWTFTGSNGYVQPNRVVNDTWTNNHIQRTAFAALGVNGINTDTRWSGGNKGSYSVGIAAKIPMKTLTSNNGDACMLVRLTWNYTYPTGAAVPI